MNDFSSESLDRPLKFLFLYKFFCPWKVRVIPFSPLTVLQLCMKHPVAVSAQLSAQGPQADVF